MNNITQNITEKSSQQSANTFLVNSDNTKQQHKTMGAADNKAADHQNPILAIIQQAEELWCNHEGQPGITISINDHSQHYLLGQSQFKDWLHSEYYKRYASSFSQSAFNDTLNTVKAICSFDSPQYRTYSRIAESDGKIYIDLANNDCQAIEIDEYDWRIVKQRLRCLPIALPVKCATGIQSALNNSKCLMTSRCYRS